MYGKIISVVITLGIIAYLFHAMFSSDSKVQSAIDNTAAMKEQKEMLKKEGIDPNDPDAVKKYADKKAKEIDEYQHSADNLMKE